MLIIVATSPASACAMWRPTVSQWRSKKMYAATSCSSTSGVTMINSARANSVRGKKRLSLAMIAA